MTVVCPAGHSSEADDYCDVCGMPIDPSTGVLSSSKEQTAPAGPATPPAPSDLPVEAPASTSTSQPCPHCGTENAAEALFCEECGYDFTTGSLPRASAQPTETPPETPTETPLSTVPTSGDVSSAELSPELEWVAELWIDPTWYEAQESPDPLPSPGLPEVVPLRRTSVLVGRKSVSRNISPDIDCGTDSGVSRRQAQMTTDGKRWFVEDLDSANGTFVGPASGALPTDPIPVGSKHELDADDRVYVGAWTRLVVRQATDEEKAALP
jgi:hypothetical protein